MARTWSCPFWKWEDGLKVYCEGCRMDFADQEAREDYIKRYCASNPGWEGCTVAQALCRRYEGSGTACKRVVDHGN